VTDENPGRLVFGYKYSCSYGFMVARFSNTKEAERFFLLKYFSFSTLSYEAGMPVFSTNSTVH
jgi:hypothetical protein